jgi:hypothetical protein
VPRSAFPAAERQTEPWAGHELFPSPPRERARQLAATEAITGHGVFGFRPYLVPPSGSATRALAVAQRRLRVAILVEEEGLERGAITRIAGWLGVSPTTIGRDIRALLAAGNTVVAAAVARASRRKAHGTVAHAL